MPTIEEAQLSFDFPSGWQAVKFDEWSFYRNQFMKLAGACLNCSTCEAGIECANCGNKNVAGTKGIDILAIDDDAVCWQIEIKDYRRTRFSNFAFLADEVALKVRDTLACLVAAKINANEAAEKQAARAALACKRVRVVLHLEQPPPKSPLESLESRKANVLQRLKQLVKSIDPRPLVVDRNDAGTVGWSVTHTGNPAG